MKNSKHWSSITERINISIITKPVTVPSLRLFHSSQTQFPLALFWCPSGLFPKFCMYSLHPSSKIHIHPFLSRFHCPNNSKLVQPTQHKDRNFHASEFTITQGSLHYTQNSVSANGQFYLHIHIQNDHIGYRKSNILKQKMEDEAYISCGLDWYNMEMEKPSW